MVAVLTQPVVVYFEHADLCIWVRSHGDARDEEWPAVLLDGCASMSGDASSE